MNYRKNLVFVLCTLAGMMSLSCGDDNKSEDVVSSELTVDVSTMQLKEGESKQFTINYNPGTDLVVTSSNAECVALDGQANKIVTTNSDSNVSVNVIAVGQDCTSVITIVDRRDAAISKTIQVTVDATQQKPPVLDKPELTVDPMSLELVPEGNSLINITYAEKADLLITSLVPECVKVNDAAAAEITTNTEGKAEVRVMAVSENCQSLITVADKEDADIYKNVNIVVLGSGDEMPILAVTPDALELVSGGSDTVMAYYTLENGTPVAQKMLKLESTNSACAAPELASVETDDSGTANIKIIAKDTGSCNAVINVEPPIGTSRSINVTVSDGEDPGPGPVVEGGSLAFDPESLSIAYSVKTENIVLNYRDGEGTGVADADVTFDYDDECIKSDKHKNAKTDENGQIKMVLTAQKDDCTTTLTAKSGDLTASADITVKAKSEYSFTLETAIDAPSYDKIGYVTVGTSDQTCAALTEATGLKKAAEDIATEEQMDLNGTSPILSTHLMTDVPVAQKSVLVIGKTNSSAKVTKAYGCKDISAADDGKTVHLDLAVVPADINGTYSVVTNFEFTDAIQPSGEVLVENMTGGDWLKFLLNFFDNPAKTIIDFLWHNGIVRLKNSDDENVKKLINQWLTANPEVVVLPVLERWIEDYSKDFKFQFEGADKSYYDLIVKDIAPSVADLSGNMQLLGTMEIAETDGVSAINKGNEKFTEVQYIWPFKTNSNCIADAYGNAKCRNRMLLSKANDGNVQSVDWTGKWADDKLTINAHSLNFKWASVLASVILIDVLPAVFDYKGNKNYKDGNYFLAFMDIFALDLIINAYQKKHEENAERYPALETGSKISRCAQAIQALAYVASESTVNSTYGQLFPTFAEQFICPIYSKLNDYAMSALAKIESSDEKPMTLEAKDCALSELSLVGDGKDNLFDGKYTRMGLPDDPVVTAHEVFGEDKKSSSRCTWDLKNGSMDQTSKGLFHTTRFK